MTTVIRDYVADDVGRCKELVNQAWDFDGNLAPTALAEFAKEIYVGGSLAESRHCRVAETDGVVVGLLFGAAGPGPLFVTESSGFRGQIRSLRRLMFVRGISIRSKLRWLSAMQKHAIGRANVAKPSDSELTLFAVDAATRGKGLGRRLLEDYIEVCRSESKSLISLETDLHSNFGFYERFGFKRVGKFESPLTALFTGDSGTTFVYVLDL